MIDLIAKALQREYKFITLTPVSKEQKQVAESVAKRLTELGTGVAINYTEFK